MNSHITRKRLINGYTAVSLAGERVGLTMQVDERVFAVKRINDQPIIYIFDSINDAEHWLMPKH
jgi:hypothetical protein